MGIIAERLKQSQSNRGLFICVAGPRFGGKTTVLGTLPGKTLLIDIASKESGSRGAVAMAKKLGNEVDVVIGKDCQDAADLVKEAVDAGYDNVAIDGISALTEVEVESSKFKMLERQNVWKAYGHVGDQVKALIKTLKEAASEHNINIVITAALSEKSNSEGVVTETSLFAKGKVALDEIKGRCPYFVVAQQVQSGKSDEGLIRILRTKTDDAGVYQARLDGIFDAANPKGFRADPEQIEEGQPVGLAALINFLKQEV